MSKQNHSHLVVSTCGTSLLTNDCNPTTKKTLLECANMSKSEFIKQDTHTIRIIEHHIQQRVQKLLEADVTEAKKMCAELNGILTTMESDAFDGGSTHHTLIATGTYLGGKTASMVQQWLKKQYPMANVMVEQFERLQTRDADLFDEAVSDIIKWITETLPGYTQGQYKVTMNLTGGFKSVNGVLQSLGLLYADEIVYLFEGASREGDNRKSLIRIPKLPFSIEVDGIIEEHITQFRLMGQCNELVPKSALLGVPEMLLMHVDDGLYGLSWWGEVLWAEFREREYNVRVLPSPLTGEIVYGSRFLKTCDGYPTKMLKHINQTLDDLARHVIENGKYNPKSLDVKSFKGSPSVNSTHECDVIEKFRILFHKERNEDGRLVYVLDEFHEGYH